MLSDTFKSTSTQHHDGGEAFDDYCQRLIRADEQKLDAAVDAVYQAAELLAPHLGLVYPYGDGRGGWVWRTLLDAAGLSEPAPNRSSTKRKMPRHLSRSVMERDEYRCKHCGTCKDLTIDHILPRSKGGGNEIENLQTLCRSCNSKKGVKDHSNEQ